LAPITNIDDTGTEEPIVDEEGVVAEQYRADSSMARDPVNRNALKFDMAPDGRLVPLAITVNNNSVFDISPKDCYYNAYNLFVGFDTALVERYNIWLHQRRLTSNKLLQFNYCDNPVPFHPSLMFRNRMDNMG
jgi:hypothetical protein